MNNPRYIPFAVAKTGASKETQQAVESLNDRAWEVEAETMGAEYQKAPATILDAMSAGRESIRGFWSNWPEINAKVNLADVIITTIPVETSLKFFVINGHRFSYVKTKNLKK